MTSPETESLLRHSTETSPVMVNDESLRSVDHAGADAIDSSTEVVVFPINHHVFIESTELIGERPSHREISGRESS